MQLIEPYTTVICHTAVLTQLTIAKFSIVVSKPSFNLLFWIQGINIAIIFIVEHGSTAAAMPVRNGQKYIVAKKTEKISLAYLATRLDLYVSA